MNEKDEVLIQDIDIIKVKKISWTNFLEKIILKLKFYKIKMEGT